MLEKPKEDFDWVDARNKCNVGTVLQRLKLEARKNVVTRNAQLQAGIAPFVFADHGDSGFSVSAPTRNDARNAVDVSPYDGKIAIAHGTRTLQVRLALNKYGVCKCKIGEDGDELDLWQVLMKALEPLLFPA